MTDVSVDIALPGDILLVTQRPDDPLAQMIVEYDRAPGNFSHSGLAGEDGIIISSYPELSRGLPVDLGGLHHDTYDHFTVLGQSVYRLDLPPGADREAVAAKLRDYPVDRDGDFAWAKIVMVAAALHVLDPSRTLPPPAVYEVLQRAIDAGEKWHSEEDFFCAEFATQLYGIPFTLADLRPPRRDEIAWFPHVARAVIAIGQKILSRGATEKQRRALDALVDAISTYDPEFFESGVRVLFKEAEELAKQATRRALVAEEHPRLPDSTVVPPALATPRMLGEWGLGTTLIAAARETSGTEPAP